MKRTQKLICAILALSIFFSVNANASQGAVKIGETASKILQVYANGNMLVAAENGKCMFTDAGGAALTRGVYDQSDGIYVYRDAGLTVLSVNGRFGALDGALKEVIPFIYEKIYAFYKGYAVAVYNGRFGVIDKDGGIALPFIYEAIDYTSLSGVFKTKLNRTGLTGVSGRVVIPNKYSYLGTLSEDMIVYEDGPKVGYLTVNGKIAVEAAYDEATLYSNGYASVLLNGKWAVIEKNGRLASEFIYDSPVFFDNNGVLVTTKDEAETTLFSQSGLSFDENHAFYDMGGGRYIHYSDADKSWSIVNSAGRKINGSGSFHTLYPLYTTEYLVAKQDEDGLFGLLDRNGQELLPFGFDEIRNIGTYVITESGGVTNIYNSRLKLVAIELKQDICGVIGGYFVFYENRMEGLCDSRGRVVISAAYDSIRGGFNGLVLAERKGKTDIFKLNEYKPAITAQAGDYRFMIDGVELVTDAAAYYENGRLTVPLKWLESALGTDCSFNWDGETKCAAITYGGQAVISSAGSHELIVGNEKVIMDFPADMINGALYIKAEYLNGLFGITFSWNADLKRLSFGGL